MTVRVDISSTGELILRTPYNQSFVYDLKSSIPAHERKWNGKDENPSNVWVVDSSWAHEVEFLIKRHYGETISIPRAQVTQAVQTAKLRVLYVGAAKEREDGTVISFAMGYDSKKWDVVIPEDVLRNWFEGTNLENDVPSSGAGKPGSKDSLYIILGLKTQTDDAEAIKKAYRQMARQWHPDVCKEPDATERFQRINNAYEILSDPDKRTMYDVGLELEADNDAAEQDRDNLRTRYRHIYYDMYKPPLRCGVITCDYTVNLGRKNVKKIHDWSDITDSHGRVLVTSWPMGADEPTVAWAQPWEI